jgi:hypothetical protein
VREYEGVMTKVVDRQTLPEGVGNTWNEIRLAKLEATDIQETTTLDNPQQLDDTLFSVTPFVVGIHTIVTDRMKRRASKNVTALIGPLTGNAIARRKNADGLTQLDSFSTSHAGAGVTLTSGHISAAVAAVKGNATETGQGEGPIAFVCHPFQLKAIQDEIVTGIGTYPVPEGISSAAFLNGFNGSLFGANVWEDGNIVIDSSDDAKGAVFAKNAIVLVEGHKPRAESRRRPDLGGGAEEMFMYDEYAYGERRDVWGVEIYSDSVQPSS